MAWAPARASFARATGKHAITDDDRALDDTPEPEEDEDEDESDDEDEYGGDPPDEDLATAVADGGGMTYSGPAWWVLGRWRDRYEIRAYDPADLPPEGEVGASIKVAGEDARQAALTTFVDDGISLLTDWGFCIFGCGAEAFDAWRRSEQLDGQDAWTAALRTRGMEWTGTDLVTLDADD